MVYIGSNGEVHHQQPWTKQRFFGLFTGFYAFMVAFVQSLIDPLTAIADSGSSTGGSARRSGTSGSSGRGGGGGGGGGGNGPRGNGGGGPRIGRIARMSDISIPGGGCSGGSCGM